MFEFKFGKYFILEELQSTLQETDAIFLEYKPLEPRQVTKETLPHIDPITRKPWRASDRLRHFMAFKKNQLRKGIKAKDMWVSFTEVDKLGIYPKASDGGTPFGIYAYPINYVIERLKVGGSLPFSERPYAQVFRIKNPKDVKKRPKIMQMKDPNVEFTRKPKIKGRFEAGRKGFNFSKFKQNWKFDPNVLFYEASNKAQEKARKKIGELMPSQHQSILRNFIVREMNNLFSSLRPALTSQEASQENNINEKLKEFRNTVTTQVPTITATKHIAYNQVNELPLIDFLYRIDIDGDFDYYNDYAKKYEDINLDKNSAKIASTKETITIDDIFKKHHNAILEHPIFKEKWEKYKEEGPEEKKEKEKDPQKELTEAIHSKEWKKVVDSVTNVVKREIKEGKKKLEESKKIAFPFADEIKKVAKVYDLDWPKAVNAGLEYHQTNVGHFLYLVSKHLAEQINSQRGEDQRPVYWTMILRKMGIEGYADRWHQSQIYSGGGGEATQGVFFHAGMLYHLGQVEREGHVDRSYQAGKPPVEMGNLLMKFKQENLIDPYQQISVIQKTEPRFFPLKDILKNYSEEEESRDLLKDKKLIDKKEEPTSTAINASYVKLEEDKWHWDANKLSKLFSNHGYYASIHFPTTHYVVRWSVSRFLTPEQIKRLEKKYGKEKAKEKIENMTQLTQGNKTFQDHYEAERFQAKKKNRLKALLPVADIAPGVVPDELSHKWDEFLEKEFKRRHKIGEEDSIPDKLSSKFNDFYARGQQIKYSGGERWKPHQKMHTYTASSGADMPKIPLHGTKIEPPTTLKKDYLTYAYGASNFHRILLGMAATFENVKWQIRNIAKTLESSNKASELDTYLAQALKLIRTYYRAKAEYKNEIEKSPQVEALVDRVENSIKETDDSLATILGNEAFAKMWGLYWKPIKQKIDYFRSMVKSQTPVETPRYRKRDYIGQKEVEKLFHVIYPGEKDIKDLPKKLINTPAHKITLREMVNYGKDRWLALLKYQRHKGMVVGGENFNKLVNQWNWIWDDPAFMALPYEIKEHSLLTQTLMEVLPLVNSKPLLEKLIQYQIEMGSADNIMTLKKKWFDGYDQYKAFEDDTEFQNIPTKYKQSHPNYLSSSDAMEIGPKAWKKLAEYYKVMLDVDVSNLWDKLFEALEKSNAKHIDIPYLNNHYVDELKWDQLEKAKVKTKDDWKAYVEFKFLSGDIHGSTKKELLNKYDDLFEKGMPKNYTLDDFNGYPYGIKYADYSFNDVKTFMKTPKELDRFMRYGLGNGQIGSYAYQTLKTMLEKWEKEK
jgi:hypothetical protein